MFRKLDDNRAWSASLKQRENAQQEYTKRECAHRATNILFFLYLETREVKLDFVLVETKQTCLLNWLIGSCELKCHTYGTICGIMLIMFDTNGSWNRAAWTCTGWHCHLTGPRFESPKQPVDFFLCSLNVLCWCGVSLSLWVEQAFWEEVHQWL